MSDNKTMKSEYARLEEENANLKHERKKDGDRIKFLEKKIKFLEFKLEEKEKVCEVMKEADKNKGERYVRLEERYKELSIRCEKLEAESQAFQDWGEETEQKLKDLTIAHKKRGSALSSAENKAISLEEANKALEKENDELEDKLSLCGNSAEIEALKGELKQKGRTLYSANLEIKELRQYNNELKDSKTALVSRNQYTSSEVESLQRHCDFLNRQLKEQEKTIKKIRKLIKKL